MISEKLSNHFRMLQLPPGDFQRLWNKVLVEREVFEPALGRTEQFCTHTGAPTQIDMKPFVFGGNSLISGSYIPIQAFRTPGVFERIRPSRSFLSSGTTSTSRSHSPFSEIGLAVYRAASTLTFFAALEEASGRTFDDFLGYSLIPRSEAAPDSSLSQMLDWISQIVPVKFVDCATFVEDCATVLQQPAWVFGTSSHFHELILNYPTCTLGAEIFLFETGGAKNLPNPINDDAKPQIYATHFGVSPKQHIFEYGMCELASQAYSWLSDVSDSDMQLSFFPRYRFPRWVRVAAANALNHCGNGRGALVIEDRARIDVGRAIRTQDDATVNPDSSFILHGRRKGAVLKGCSMRFAKGVQGSSKDNDHPNSVQFSWISNPSTPERLELSRGLKACIESASFAEALGLEIGSTRAAEFTIQDFLHHWPVTGDDWTMALKQSQPTIDGVPTSTLSTLFILPNNHSLAGLYPVILALLHGMRITVRVPKKFDHTRSALRLFLDEVERLAPNQTQRIPASFRIRSSADASKFDAVFGIGSSDTADELHALCESVPSQNLGSVITLDFVPTANLTQFSSQIVRDCLSLGQRGCLSTRLIVCPGKNEDIIRSLSSLNQEFENFWGERLAAEDQVSLEENEIEQLLQGKQCIRLRPGGLVVIDAWEPHNQKHLDESIREAIAPAPFMFCFLRVPQSCDLKTVRSSVAKNTEHYRIGISPSDHQQLDGDFFALGSANRGLWDGTFAGTALFKFVRSARL